MESQLVTTARRQPFGDVYDLLAERFPLHRSKQGLLEVRRLAHESGFSHETIYRAVRTNKVSTKLAKALVELSEKAAANDILDELDVEPLTTAEFSKYLFN